MSHARPMAVQLVTMQLSDIMNKLQTQTLKLSFVSTTSLTKSYGGLFWGHNARLSVTMTLQKAT